MQIKLAILTGVLVLATFACAEGQKTTYVVSTSSDWEARLAFVQYGDIQETEGRPPRIPLKGNVPSSAVVLGVECTALLDLVNATNSLSYVCDMPLVFIAHAGLNKSAAAVEQPALNGDFAFTDMSVIKLFNAPNPVLYLSGVKARKGQTITALFAYELSAENRASLAASPVITVDYLNKHEVELPVIWPLRDTENITH